MDTDTDADTDFLADVRAARSARRQSPPTFVRRALFLARMSVGDARVYTCTCTVHDKLSCTHLQNKKHLKNVGPIRHCEPFYIAIHQMSLSHAA